MARCDVVPPTDPCLLDDDIWRDSPDLLSTTKQRVDYMVASGFSRIPPCCLILSRWNRPTHALLWVSLYEYQLILGQVIYLSPSSVPRPAKLFSGNELATYTALRKVSPQAIAFYEIPAIITKKLEGQYCARKIMAQHSLGEGVSRGLHMNWTASYAKA